MSTTESVATHGVCSNGVDYSWARPDAAELYRLGYRFACRYLSWLPNGKVIQPSELDYLTANGIAVVLNWEFDARDAMGGYTSGVEHAKEALRQAESLGCPDDRPIYFSVDFDMQPDEIDVVGSYFDGVQSVLPRSRVGCYGSAYTVATAHDCGWADWFWQTYAWSYGEWTPAHIRQFSNGVMVAGGEVDLNYGMYDDIGAWGVDTMGAQDVWNHDIDPAGGSTYTAGGAQWTTLSRTGYLANTFAPQVLSRLDDIAAGSTTKSTRSYEQAATWVTLIVAIALLTLVVGFLAGLTFVGIQ